MSFATLGDKQSSPKTLPVPEQVKRLFSEMLVYLLAIEQQLPRISQLSKTQRNDTYGKVKAANDLAVKVNKLIRDYYNSETKSICDRWKRDLEKEMGRLTRLTNALKRAELNIREEAALEEVTEKDAFLSDATQQQTDQFEVQLHMDILSERDHKISQITTSIQQVNGLFKEISLMVSGQGEVLDRIEDHLGESVEQTKKTVQELEKADQRTKDNKRRQCCLVLLAVLMLLVVSLFSGLYLRKS